MNARTAEADLERVRQDLSTLRDAAAIGLPFGMEVVRFWLVISAGSAIVASALAFGTATYKLVAMGLFALVGAGLLVGVMVHLGRATVQRHEKPAPFREFRQIMAVKAIVLPFVVAFFAWQASIGVPWQYLASTAAFFTGVTALLYAISAWSRRLAAGIAIPIMVFAALIPVVAIDQMLLAGALCVTMVGLLSASILAWQLAQLRRDSVESK